MVGIHTCAARHVRPVLYGQAGVATQTRLADSVPTVGADGVRGEAPCPLQGMPRLPPDRNLLRVSLPLLAGAPHTVVHRPAVRTHRHVSHRVLHPVGHTDCDCAAGCVRWFEETGTGADGRSPWRTKVKQFRPCPFMYGGVAALAISTMRYLNRVYRGG